MAAKKITKKVKTTSGKVQKVRVLEKAIETDISLKNEDEYLGTLRHAHRPEMVIDWNNIEHLAALGFTETEIAERMGIGDRTLVRHKKKYEEIRRKVQKGKEDGAAMVANALYARAIGLNNGGQVDVAACKLYLSRRASKKWGGSSIKFDLPESGSNTEKADAVIMSMSRGELPLKYGTQMLTSLSERMKIEELETTRVELNLIKEIPEIQVILAKHREQIREGMQKAMNA